MYDPNLREQLKQEAAGLMNYNGSPSYDVNHHLDSLYTRYSDATGANTHRTEQARANQLKYSAEQEAKRQAKKARAKVKTIKKKIAKAKKAVKLAKQQANNSSAGPVRCSKCSVRGGKVYCRPVGGSHV
jgi:hypothetical protein